jgi:hypothetical protein
VAETFKSGNAELIKSVMTAMGADAAMDYGDFAFYFSDIFVESV